MSLASRLATVNTIISQLESMHRRAVNSHCIDVADCLLRCKNEIMQMTRYRLLFVQKHIPTTIINNGNQQK